MIVGLPRGTAIDGQDLTGWATDMFMSGKNQKQKNEGRAVNLRFKPDTPVELFTGRGTERRTMQVDPQTLVRAIIDAQKRNRDAEETLDTHRWNSPTRPWRNPGRKSAACRAGSRNTSELARTSRPSQ